MSDKNERFGAIRELAHTSRDPIALWDALAALPEGEERDEAERYALDVWGLEPQSAWQLARQAAWELGLGRRFKEFPPGQYELWYYDPNGGHHSENVALLGIEDEDEDEEDDDAFGGLDGYERVAQAGSMEELMGRMFEDFEADSWEIEGEFEQDTPWSKLRDERLRMEADLINGESSMMGIEWSEEGCVYAEGFIKAVADSREFVVAWEAIPHLQDVATCVLRVCE